jgi:hypothetical protein
MIPLLVVSCDRYSDLWNPFFTIFRKRWPDCPFPLYLGTNNLRFDGDGVHTVAIGDDRSWTENVRRMLDVLASEHVILFLEDFLLTEKVSTSDVVRLTEVAVRERVGCLRLVADMPLALKPSAPIARYPGLGVIEPGEWHRVTAQVSVWRTDTLRKLLFPGASAWEFEAIGGRLSDRFSEPFWGVYDTVVSYEQVVEKGKWKPAGLALCTAAGIVPDTSVRGVFSDAELIEHLALGNTGVLEYQRKREIERLFSDGRRMLGLRMTAAELRRRPAALMIWALGLCGLVGRSCVRRAESALLGLRLARIRRRTRR